LNAFQSLPGLTAAEPGSPNNACSHANVNLNLIGEARHRLVPYVKHLPGFEITRKVDNGRDGRQTDPVGIAREKASVPRYLPCGILRMSLPDTNISGSQSNKSQPVRKASEEKKTLKIAKSNGNYRVYEDHNSIQF
jgi:hypothetical protein